MMNHNKSSESISDFGKQSDIEIAMEFLSRYYCIHDSILVNFQRKAKETISRQAEEAICYIANRTAKILLKIIIEK